MISLTAFEPIIVFTLLNVTIVLGLYVMNLSGQLSMATGAIAGIGAYAAAILTTNFDWPLIPAVAVAIVAGCICGAFLALVTYRMQDFVLKLTTLAFGEAIAIAALNIDYIGGAEGFSGIPLYTTTTTAAVAALLAVYVVWRYDGSRLGLASRAVRDDVIAARSNGISVLSVRASGAIIGAAIIAGGGALQAHYTLLVTPHELGFFASLNFVIFLLFGGMYTMFGPILGAVLLTLLPEVTRSAAEYRYIIYGLVLLLVVIYRPQGILSPARDK